MGSLVQCAICKTPINLDRFGEYVSSVTGAAVCKHCAVSVSREALSEAVSETPTPPLRVEASATTRAMMRTLGDQLAMTLPLHAGTITAACERAVTDLRTGRLDLLMISAIDISRAAEAMGEALNQSQALEAAIAVVDPAYIEACEPTRTKLLVTHERRRYAKMGTIDLGSRLVVHRTECKDPKCYKHIALEAELAARGVVIP